MILIVEGNISAGKTTIIDYLATKFRNRGYIVEVFLEGVDDTPLKNLLKLFYTDIPKYAFALQTAFFTRLYFQQQQAIKLRKKGIICLMDRSLFGNNVFTTLHYETDNLSINEYNLLQSMITHFPYIDTCDYMLYIRTSPKICLERQKLRGRKGEITPLNYLVQLSQMYDKHLEHCPIEFEIINWEMPLVIGLEFLDFFVDRLIIENYQKYKTSDFEKKELVLFNSENVN